MYAYMRVGTGRIEIREDHALPDGKPDVVIGVRAATDKAAFKALKQFLDHAIAEKTKPKEE